MRATIQPIPSLRRFRSREAASDKRRTHRPIQRQHHSGEFSLGLGERQNAGDPGGPRGVPRRGCGPDLAGHAEQLSLGPASRARNQMIDRAAKTTSSSEMRRRCGLWARAQLVVLWAWIHGSGEPSPSLSSGSLAGRCWARSRVRVPPPVCLVEHQVTRDRVAVHAGRVRLWQGSIDHSRSPDRWMVPPRQRRPATLTLA